MARAAILNRWEFTTMKEERHGVRRGVENADMRREADRGHLTQRARRKSGEKKKKEGR